MEPGETSYREEKRQFPMAFAAGAVIVLLIFGGFLVLTRVMRPHDSATAAKLPFGAGEQGYVQNIHFLDIQLAHASKFLESGFYVRRGNGVQRRAAENSRNGSHRGISRSVSSSDFARYEPTDRSGRTVWMRESASLSRSRWNIYPRSGIKQYPSIRSHRPDSGINARFWTL